MSLLNFAGYCYFQELEKLKQENKELYEELLELRRQIQVKISHTTNSLLQVFGQLGRDLVAKKEIRSSPARVFRRSSPLIESLEQLFHSMHHAIIKKNIDSLLV